MIVRLRAKDKKEIEEYEQLKEEIARLWNMKKVTVNSVVIGALGCVSNCFGSCLEKVGVEVK